MLVHHPNLTLHSIPDTTFHSMSDLDEMSDIDSIVSFYLEEESITSFELELFNKETAPSTRNESFFIESFQKTGLNNFKELKKVFIELSKIFNNSKIYVSLEEYGYHFNWNYKFRLNEMKRSEPSRFDSTEYKRKYLIFRNDGIIKNKEIYNIDYHLLINSQIEVRVPYEFDKKFFKYYGCWNFEEFKPILLIPNINRLNEFGNLKFRSILEIDEGEAKCTTIKEVLMQENKIDKKLNRKISLKIQEFREFYDKVNYNQHEIRLIEQELNNRFIEFIDLVIFSYYKKFNKFSALSYIEMYHAYVESEVIDFSYLLLSYLNIPYFFNTECIKNLHDEYELNFKIKYSLMLIIFLKSKEVNCFILRSLLFQSESTVKYKNNEFIIKIDRLIARSPTIKLK